MKTLDRVTLVIVDTKNYAQALFSLKKSLSEIKPARTLFFTDIDIPNLPDGIELIKIPSIKSKKEYSHWIIKELWQYILTDFVLVTQWDGHVLSGDSWNDEFYNYDYIGAPWIYEHGRNIGNGGFSLRSRLLCGVLAHDTLIEVTHPEDQAIGIIYRRYLEEKYKFVFPDEELADTFSFELKAPTCKTFGFHGFFHELFSEVIMITRGGAGGDVVALEPILHHFHKKGYRVALKTAPHFFNMFAYHYFKVYHPQELDPRIPVREIVLDMAYETNPKQLHLKSYYEMCGVSDGEIRNPKLSLNFDHKNPQNKLFKKKYVTLHIDERLQHSRNIYGVDWIRVVDYLKSEGYEVLQVGNGDHEEIKGAVQFQAPNEIMLMSVIGGASCHIGCDSGPSNIAVAMGTPAVIGFGSVNPDYIFPDLTNVVAIHNHHKKVCETPFCWANTEGCTGTPCYIDDINPPCAEFTAEQFIEGIKKIIS